MNDARRRTDLRRSLMGALAAWAVVATLGVVALVVQAGQNRAALHEATSAVKRANAAVSGASSAGRQSSTATSLANASLLRLQAEALGLCAAAGSTRAYVDQEHQVLHALLNEVGHLEIRSGHQLAHGVSKTVRAAGVTELHLGAETVAASSQIVYLAPLDCPALTANPQTYTLPVPQPFGSPGAPK